MTSTQTQTGAGESEASVVLSTLNDDGSRRWLKPRLSPGRFLRSRRAIAYLLIAIFASLPWIKINGKQALLFDLATRRFSVFGKTFLPTDTVLLALLLVGTFLTIFLVTALFGRIWCGWACPQTVYLEFLYRPIERFFEGSPGRGAKNWFQRSGFGKIAKYPVYLVISFALANIFLAYFVPTETLLKWITRPPTEHFAGFLVVAAVTGLMMFDFSFFREQTCLVACPYGRFQSVLLDRQSMIVAYDKNRGEPRGKARKVSLPVVGEAVKNGDCIDCTMCVQTCPTGIDIRNGLQMECVHCTQCIDACDAIMDKVGKPRGLISYRSQAMLAGEKSHLLRPRTLIYPIILLVIATVFVLVLVNQAPSYIRVIRGLGRPWTEIDAGMIENPIKIKIINRHETEAEYTFRSVDGQSAVRTETPRVTVPSGETAVIQAMIVAPKDKFRAGHYLTEIDVIDSQGYTKRVTWNLLGPASGTNNKEQP